ncbi:MAG: tetratricopeptide repeat protein, partial [Saprospiraceae bacterium]|nr:tetratricopeptide repeat protein [Saprospiraceae bacterium]
VRDDVKNQRGLILTSLGPRKFKNVEDEIEIFAIANKGLTVPVQEPVAGKAASKTSKSQSGRLLLIGLLILAIAFGTWYWLGGDSSDGPGSNSDSRLSIAVLPLRNLKDDPNLEYFSDGVAQEITDELAKISAFSVTAFTTSMAYKNSPKSIPEIADELQLDYLVSGTSRIELTTDSVILSIELIDPGSQKRVWNGKYLEVMDNAATLQLSVTRQIAASLDIKLTSQEEIALNTVNTVSGDAFDLFLKARANMNMLNVAGFDQAEQHLLRAIQIDPDYAQAYTLLAWNYVLQGWRWFWRGHLSIEDARLRAQKNIDAAIRLNPNSSDIYLVRGNFNATFEANISQAIADVERALRINSWPDVPTDYCVCTAVTNYVIAGMLAQAKEIANLASEIDPGNVFIYHDQGIIYMQEGKMLQAQAMFQKAVDQYNIPILNFFLGWGLYHNGQYAEAIPHFEIARVNDTLEAPIHLAYLSNAYFHLGNESLSAQFRERVVQRYQNTSEGMDMPMAIISAAQGSKDETLTHLEQAFANREPMMTYLLNIDPIYWPLHDEPRFRRIREQMGYYR